MGGWHSALAKLFFPAKYFALCGYSTGSLAVCFAFLFQSFSDGQECTFGQLLGAVSDVYAVLKQHGLKEGDKVLPLMQPGFAFYAAIVASFCLGMFAITDFI